MGSCPLDLRLAPVKSLPAAAIRPTSDRWGTLVRRQTQSATKENPAPRASLTRGHFVP